MKSHPVVGAEIVAPLDFFSEGATLIRCHHERFDGSGYPDGLKAEEIPLGAALFEWISRGKALGLSGFPFKG